MYAVLPSTITRLVTHRKPSRPPHGIKRQHHPLNLTITPHLDSHHPLYSRLGPNSLSRYPHNPKMETLFTTSKPKPQITTTTTTTPSATRLEIILLALFILSLVLLLLLILALALRRQVSTSTNKRRHHRSSHQPDVHGRTSSPCLFNTAFGGGPLPHEPLLSSSTSLPADGNEKTSLLNRVRKASEDLAEAVQYELMELGRKVSAHGRAVMVGATAARREQQERRTARDEEVGLDAAAGSGLAGQQQHGFDGWRDQDWGWDTEACSMVGPKPKPKLETVVRRSISWVMDRGGRRSSYAYSRGFASPCNTGGFRPRMGVGGGGGGGRRRSLAVTGAEYAV
ncbi:uncharacterized protein PODANS_7_7955 [Podospora anserina S mat+]|uniref:Podospora anserina S mat+ genomic DNA chromosome 7, supercontig 1 n=1 Tax=Podospora anserina (strain S / ATCC MYA-4624 / DSM 980 / FGSC 10383) TaxID=515849 RepID=B2AWQ4_PODAN|nr:uncharacterized protein PODANS_7_7955 [Podospora anserina S mat+]CAP68828.1 unnamed protein product [Podospora anserina S mat+]CDP32298.1 Putative protein of unknown function [Podospora anserina S mat+]